MKIIMTLSTLAFGLALLAQTSTEKEVLKTIVDGNQYTMKNLTGPGDGISKNGSLEFWSSGGLLQEVPPNDTGGSWDVFKIYPKHIQVITLVEGQAAVAMYYSEGSLQPKGGALASHYLTRVMEVYVKEDGKWKLRAAHWSPITGGGGTTQTAIE